jgi:hydroxymethylglutaryl-CoA synthase
MGMSAIESVGTYVPRYRISAETIGEAWNGFEARGVHEKRVAAGDEDAVTMAVEAAKDALAASTYGREEIETLALGTTTPPVEEGDVGVQVAEIMGLERSTEVVVHSQSTRAGTRALVGALRADSPGLVVAADSPLGEPDDAVDHAAGAGAVALVVGDDGANVVETATYTQEYPGTRFRQRGSETTETYDATAYERDAYTTVIGGAVGKLTESPDAIAPTAPDGSMPNRAAGVADGATVYHYADELGDTGAASPLFGLVSAWEDDASSVTVVGFGDGAGADAVTIDGSLPVEIDRAPTDISYTEYLRKRGHILSNGGDA